MRRRAEPSGSVAALDRRQPQGPIGTGESRRGASRRRAPGRPPRAHREEQKMSTAWQIKGRELANCNCAYGCPCQFNALPTHGDCRALIGYQIDEGHYGDVRLDGLRAALIVSWPGPIHEGNGMMQIVVDERADARQREALRKIILGEDTKEMATVWWVFSAMAPHKQETLYKRIDFEVDIEKRTGRMTIPGIAEMSGEPIRNP